MRVLLADDRPKTRFALRLLLERQPGIQIVGEAADAQELLVQVKMTCANVVLLDWELPNLGARWLSAVRSAQSVPQRLCDCTQRPAGNAQSSAGGRGGCVCQQGGPAGTVVGGRAQCRRGNGE